MDEHFLCQEEELWKCRKHPSRRHHAGICPSCLCDRLIFLCPDCANVRPCACYPSSSSSSSFTFGDPARSSVSGAISRVSGLLEDEPPIRRSRSLAFSFRRPRSSDFGLHPNLPPTRWGQFWPFFSKAKERKEDLVAADYTNFMRSRSMGVANYSDEKKKRTKGWKWHFPSPMRAFRFRKPTQVVHERSPMCRG